jgi:NADH-quinone oxidoreductase subunit L
VPEISVPENARYPFMQTDAATPEGEVEVLHHEVIYSKKYTDAIHSAHYPAMILSLLVAGGGILLAFFMYKWKKINPDKIADKFKPLYNLSYNKWYFDEFYDKIFVGGTLQFSKALAWFDNTIVDGIVNLSATVTRLFSRISGAFDTIVVDGLVNLLAYISGFIGLIFRSFQTGKVQTYVIFVIFSLVILLFLFKTF